MLHVLVHVYEIIIIYFYIKLHRDKCFLRNDWWYMKHFIYEMKVSKYWYNTKNAIKNIQDVNDKTFKWFYIFVK